MKIIDEFIPLMNSRLSGFVENCYTKFKPLKIKSQ